MKEFYAYKAHFYLKKINEKLPIDLQTNVKDIDKSILDYWNTFSYSNKIKSFLECNNICFDEELFMNRTIDCPLDSGRFLRKNDNVLSFFEPKKDKSLHQCTMNDRYDITNYNLDDVTVDLIMKNHFPSEYRDLKLTQLGI